MAEIESSVPSRQRLDRRIAGRATSRREAAAGTAARSAANARVDRRFATADARIELKRLYPTIQG